MNQQHLSAIHRVRERAIGNRTALVNQIRSLLHELGIIIPQGIQKFRKALPAILTFENSQIPHGMVTLFQSLYEELCLWDERIKTIEEQLHSIAKNNESCARLMKIPGVGVLTASAIVAHVGDARHFKNGRQFAASLGLMLMCRKETQKNLIDSPTISVKKCLQMERTELYLSS